MTDPYLLTCEQDAIENPRIRLGMMVEIFMDAARKEKIGTGRVVRAEWDNLYLEYGVEIQEVDGQLSWYLEHHCERLVFNGLKSWLKGRVINGDRR